MVCVCVCVRCACVRARACVRACVVCVCRRDPSRDGPWYHHQGSSSEQNAGGIAGVVPYQAARPNLRPGQHLVERTCLSVYCATWHVIHNGAQRVKDVLYEMKLVV